MRWMRHSLPWLLIAVTSWIVFMPAYALVSKLEGASQGRLKALDSAGTIWAGSAVLGLSDGGQMRMIPGELRWSWNLFDSAGLVSITIEHPNLSQPLIVGLNGLSLIVQDIHARIPAAWLSALGAPFNTIKPEGLLVIKAEAIDISNPDYDFQIDWQDAQSALTSIRPLGKYAIRLTGHGSQRLDLDIQTKSGPLYVQAKGGMSANGAFQFNGLAWPSEDSRAALTGILSQMGRFTDGKYQLGTSR